MSVKPFRNFIKSTENESVEMNEKSFIKKIKMDKFNRNERQRKKKNIKSIKKYNKNVLGIESVELDEAWTADSVIKNAEIGSKKGYGIIIKKAGGVTKTPFKHMLLTTRKHGNVRVTFDHGKGEFEGTPQSVALHINQTLGIKESVELDEARAITFVVTPDYEFDGEKNVDVPKTLKIKVDARTMAGGYEEVEEYISDEISNVTGWLHNGFYTKPDIEKVTESVELEEKPFLKKIKMDKFSRSERKRKKENIKKIRKYNKMVGIPLASSYDAESVEEEISTTTSSVGTLTDPVERGVTPKKKKRKCEIEKFIGSRVFEVSNDEYCRCLKGRNKYERWNKYFDTESTSGSSIKKYSHKHPNNPIIIKDEKTGEMMFLRRRLNDNRLRHNKRNN